MAKKEKSKIYFHCSVSRNSAIYNYAIGGKMIHHVAEHVLKAKLQDLPFSVLKNAVGNPPSKKDFLNYLNVDIMTKSRIPIPHKDLHNFPEWEDIRKNLSRIYGNIETDYNSIMQTSEEAVGSIHASMHHDLSDVIHLNCYGRVEWLLVDPYEFRNNKNRSEIETRVILEPGDLLYMRAQTLHETIPLTERGSLIFMNLPYNDDEEIPLNRDKQREEFIEYIEKGVIPSEVRPKATRHL